MEYIPAGLGIYENEVYLQVNDFMKGCAFQHVSTKGGKIDECFTI